MFKSVRTTPNLLSTCLLSSFNSNLISTLFEFSFSETHFCSKMEENKDFGCFKTDAFIVLIFENLFFPISTKKLNRSV